MELRVAGTGAEQYGQFYSGGAITLGGNLLVTLDPSYTPVQGDHLLLMNTGGTISGAFANVSVPGGWTLTQGAQSLELQYLPEPGSVVYVIACAAGLLARRRGT
jgi:hypothetical protein